MKFRLSHSTNGPISFGPVLILLAPLVLGCNPSGSTGPFTRDQHELTRPLDLHIVYEATGKQVPGSFRGEMTLEFKNRLPLPVRIAFPPVGVFSGGSVPFCDEGQDSIPKFAKTAQIIEIGPRETKTFTAPSGVWIPEPNQVEWVFGKPAEGGVPKNLFVGSLISTCEVRRGRRAGTTNGRE